MRSHKDATVAFSRHQCSKKRDPIEEGHCLLNARLWTMALAVFQIVFYLTCFFLLMVLFLRPNLWQEVLHRIRGDGYPGYLAMASPPSQEVIPFDEGADRFDHDIFLHKLAYTPLHQKEYTQEDKMPRLDQHDDNEAEDVKETPRDISPYGVSPRRTIHMVIYGQRHTLLFRDKEGRMHIANMMEFRPPVIIPPHAEQQSQDNEPALKLRDLVAHRPVYRRRRYAVKDSASDSGAVLIDQAPHLAMNVDRDMPEKLHQRYVGHEHAAHDQGFLGKWIPCLKDVTWHQRRHHAAALLFVWLSLCFSCCLFYGVSTRQSVFLLPYLGAQLVCLVFCIIWMMQSVHNLHNLKAWLASHPNVLFRLHLLAMSHRQLGLLFILACALILIVKVNVITLVWVCYKRLRAAEECSNMDQNRAFGASRHGNGTGANCSRHFHPYHHHRRSVSDSIVLLYEKVIPEEDETLAEMEEEKVGPINSEKNGEIENGKMDAPPAYVKDDDKCVLNV